MKRFPISTILGLALGILLAFGVAVSAFQSPTQAPPQGNVPAPLNVGPADQTKTGGLLQVFNLWVNSALGVTGGATFGGNVGIGVPNPGQKLSVAGIIESTAGGFKFPDGSVQTSASLHGKQMFTSSGTFTVPAGVTKVWVTMVGGGGGGGGGEDTSGVAGGTGIPGGQSCFDPPGPSIECAAGGNGGGGGGVGNGIGECGLGGVGGSGAIAGGDGYACRRNLAALDRPDQFQHQVGGLGGSSMYGVQDGKGYGIGGTGGNGTSAAQSGSFLREGGGGGGGGGGAAANMAVPVSVNPGDVISITVGNGGSGGSPSSMCGGSSACWWGSRATGGGNGALGFVLVEW